MPILSAPGPTHPPPPPPPHPRRRPLLLALPVARPAVYARLVLAVYRGRIAGHDGAGWGGSPDLNPDLLASHPAESVMVNSFTALSVADWMVAGP